MIKRRHFLAGFAALGAPWPALADAGAPSLNLLVGGPDGAGTSRWAAAAALAFSAGFPGTPTILAQPTGGLDGVTGANRLDALVVPDGKTAAMLPGASITAWLTGDERVHFDPTRWVPVMAATGSGVLVVRLGATPPSLKALQTFQPLRLGADAPQSNDLAALLALECIGIPTAPVFGLREAADKIRAFAAGQVDAVFLAGEGVPEDIAPFTANAGVPVFCTGQMTTAGAVAADPLFPGLPPLESFAPFANPQLAAVYQAAAAAARLDVFMVLPKLTDPAAIAAWRQAAAAGIAAPALAAAASASSVTLRAADITGAAFATFNLSPDDQAGLQGFLTRRFGAQAGSSAG